MQQTVSFKGVLYLDTVVSLKLAHTTGYTASVIAVRSRPAADSTHCNCF